METIGVTRPAPNTTHVSYLTSLPRPDTASIPEAPFPLLYVPLSGPGTAPLTRYPGGWRRRRGDLKPLLEALLPVTSDPEAIAALTPARIAAARSRDRDAA